MTLLADIEATLEAAAACPRALSRDVYLNLGENVLEAWIEARDQTPTTDKKEGFRLLALHRQGAKGDPSFNACRETCREIAYRYVCHAQDYPPDGDANTDRDKQLELLWHLTNHLYLFVSGKMQTEELGEFCCSSKSIRLETAETI